MNKERLQALKKQSTINRKHIIDAIFSASSGHPGGSLSCIDILTALYFNEMKIDPKNPKWEDRDRFVLSKGHCAPALYACLAERGFFDKAALNTLRKTDSFLEGHPSMKTVPGVDMSTGSLGQGISTAVGMALSAKMSSKKNRVYTILGDGEIQEGQVWEALMAAAHYKLDNLVAFLDHNGLQIDGDIKEVMNPEPVVEKFRAFNWHVIKIDGHDFAQIEDALRQARQVSGRPVMIVAECCKGKGVSFMENQAGWHGNAPSADQRETAIAELNEYLVELEVEQHG